MINKLTLTGFGKFRQAVFDLSGVTLVYGPNEAGKTTFFDGLFQALCRPSETKKSGKVLKARYGAGRAAQAVITNDVPITDEEFMNLYAIREGDLRLELDKGTEWLDKLKSRLFHGGLDPSVLAAEFEKRSSDSRTHTHNKEMEKAREAAAKARQELDGKKRERDSLLAREKSLADTEAELEETRRLLRDAAAEAADLEKHASGEDKIAMRQKWSAMLARLEDWEALETEAKVFAPYREDRRPELNGLMDASRQAAAAIHSEKGKRDQQANLVSQAKAEGRSLREARDAATPRSAAAKRLADEARAVLAGKTSAGRPPLWSSVLAVSLMVSGAVGGFFATGVAAFASLILGLALAGLSFFSGLRARDTVARNVGAKNLSRWKDEWNLSAVPGAGTGAGDMSTVEGFLQAMEACARERETLEAREAEAARRLETLMETLEKLDASLAGLKEAEEAARRSEREWLARHGVDGAEEYALKVSRSLQIQADLPRRRGELETLAQGSDLESFRREARRKLQGLDEEGIPEKGLDDAALQRMRKRRQEIQDRREVAGRRERELIAKREGLAGEIRGAFGKLAGEIVACEDRLAAAEADIHAKELDKQAAALALEIFRDIGDGADLLLAGLSREMEAMLGNILPAGRAVSLLGLEDRLIQVKDAGGGTRSLDNLSTGTKHAMVLAAKLAMALKHRQGPGILVLDEPFLAMDDERETRALELLRDFHTRHGWQIILMTKETGLKDKVLKLFAAPRLVDLSLFG